MAKSKKKGFRFAVIVSRFNSEITEGLLKGALVYLESEGVKVSAKDLVMAPGAFEIPLLAKRLARSKKYDGVICLGCVIKGDTAHFEFISLGASVGIQQAMLETEVPIAFGVLTTYTEEQALVRSRPGHENKGREAAQACLETARMLKRL